MPERACGFDSHSGYQREATGTGRDGNRDGGRQDRGNDPVRVMARDQRRRFGPFGVVPLRFQALAVLGVLVLFWLNPGLDLWITALFYDADAGFWVERQPQAVAVRMTLWWLQIGFALAVFARVAAPGALVRFDPWPDRVWRVIAVLVLVGPILIVNGLLKTLWGRARPRSLSDFGGEWSYTPPMQIAGDCQSNCSFVSGEVAGAAVLAISLVFLALTSRNRGLRRVLYGAPPLVVASVGLLRVAMGGHFLSDVVLSVMFMWVLAEVILRRAPLVDPLDPGGDQGGDRPSGCAGTGDRAVLSG